MRRGDPFIRRVPLIVKEGVIAGSWKDHPVSKILPSLLPDVQHLLTMDLAEMQMCLGKRTPKLDLQRGVKCLILSPLLRMRVGGLEGYNIGRRKCIFTVFIILLKLIMIRGKLLKGARKRKGRVTFRP